MNWLDNIKWDAQGLVPVIAQEQGSKDVLMFAWMNREALARTAELGEAEGERRAEAWRRRRVAEVLASPLDQAVSACSRTV